MSQIIQRRTCEGGHNVVLNFVCPANADVLLTPIIEYRTGFASYDLGTTWVPMTAWGPRGSTPPTAPRPASLPPEDTDLIASPPLFYT